MELQDPALLRQDAFIDGAWRRSDAQRTYAVTDPASGALLARVVRCTADDAQAAVEAAARAQPRYAAETAKARGALLRRMASLMLAHEEDLATIMTREQGKPLAEARGEVKYAAGFLEWFGEEARRVDGRVLPAHRGDTRLLVLRQPVGVCAGITPWNFPSAMITRKLGPALATGCTIVIKPAEATPLSALALAELATRAGLPPGVLNVLPGDREDAAALGAVLTGSPTVRKLSFTGSTAVGKLLAEQCARTVKRVSLELGGNAAFIVFDDADLDAAVEGLMIAKFRNSGQTCVAANRVLVQQGVYEPFMTRLAERVAALKVGPGMDPGVQIGPLINEAGLAKCHRHVQDALSHGARAVVGGRPHALGGTFYCPTLLEGITPDMQLTQEETFGPVAGVTRFASEHDAVALANDTPSGLAAYFYSRDLARVFRVSEALEVGMVGVNTGLVSTEVAPFGGVKESGLGREGSSFGVDDWTELKYVCAGGLDVPSPA